MSETKVRNMATWIWSLKVSFDKSKYYWKATFEDVSLQSERRFTSNSEAKIAGERFLKSHCMLWKE